MKTGPLQYVALDGTARNMIGGNTASVVSKVVDEAFDKVNPLNKGLCARHECHSCPAYKQNGSC